MAIDATHDRVGTSRVAAAAHVGNAHAIVPSHTPFDSNLVFAASPGPLAVLGETVTLRIPASVRFSRVTTRGVHTATVLESDDSPTWSARFG